MAEEGVERLLPDLALSEYRYLLSLPWFERKEETKKKLLDSVFENSMFPCAA